MKISFNRAVALLVIAALIICLCVSIIFMVNNNKIKKANSEKQLVSNLNNSSYVVTV